MARPSVLVIHNRYLQPGGEDAVVRSEIALLRQHGHRVLQYARHNREIAGFSGIRKARLAITTTWDQESYAQLRALIRQERPEIAHCHNLLPLLSPSAYYACAAEGVPVVQAVHNYRLLCPGGNFFREGSACTDCNGSLTKAVLRGCYHGSRRQTATIGLMLGIHRALRTWQDRVTTYIAPSAFCRSRLTEHALPPNRVTVKSHFVSDVFPQAQDRGDYVIFVGRLSEDKGILPLLETWRELKHIPLVVVGSGPLDAAAHRLASSLEGSQIHFTGHLPHSEALRLMCNARFLVAPSRCYETFGLTVLEAMACGIPSIVPRIGALPELVCDRRTGMVADVDNPEELSRAIRYAWSHWLETREMGRAARAHCIEHYSAETNYRKLTQIYTDATPVAATESPGLLVDLAAAAAALPLISTESASAGEISL
jgi:glycosyltransferase involved in cell wall biosynthesis